MHHLVSGISFLCLFVNLILAPVPPFPTHLFLHPSLLPLLIHHFVHLQLHLSFTPGLKLTSFTNPNPVAVVSLLPFGLPPRTFACTVSSELFDFVEASFDFVSLFADLSPVHTCNNVEASSSNRQHCRSNVRLCRSIIRLCCWEQCRTSLS